MDKVVLYFKLYSELLFENLFGILLRPVMSVGTKVFNFYSKANYPSVLLDPVYGRHKFVKLQNITLHYVENGEKNSELMIFLHGFPDFWFSWRNQILEFSKDYWTVAVDMRGYGESEKKKGAKNYKIEVLVDDIKDLIYNLGKTRCTLVAHDWGGAVGHYFIRTYPHMLDKYIFLNTAYPITLNEMVFKNKQQFRKSWYIFIMMLPLVPEWFLKAKNFKKFEHIFGKFCSKEEVAAYKYMFQDYDQRNGPVNYYRANFKLIGKLPKHPTVNALNSCNIPGLYIHGEKDFAITKEVAIIGSFKGINNVKVVIIPDADHFVQMQSPQLINKIMRDFLSREIQLQQD